jgi:hypothetical protein
MHFRSDDGAPLDFVPGVAAVPVRTPLLDPRCPLTQADLDEVRRVRAKLLDHGFAPLAVHSIWSLARTRHRVPETIRDGVVIPESFADGEAVDRGKQPKAGWRDPAHPSRTRDALMKVSPITANTGIVTGSVRAIDVDIHDTEPCRAALAALLQALDLTEAFRAGRIPMRWRANSAKCLLAVRARDPGAVKRVVTLATGKVEILGDGQQFIAHGQHPSDPSGGVSVQWYPKPLWEYDVDDLIEI